MALIQDTLLVAHSDICAGGLLKVLEFLQSVVFILTALQEKTSERRESLEHRGYSHHCRLLDERSN
jgi:hypothetical protein